MRAILAARATVTLLTCILECSCRSHAPNRSRDRSRCMTHDLAPCIKSFAKIAVPPLADAKHLGFASCGILLRNEAKPGGHVTGFLKLLPVSSAARSAVAPSGPIPGIVISLRAFSSLAASASISRVTSAMRFSKSHQILEELIKQPPHCRGQVVAFVGNDPGQIRFEETSALADRNSVLEAEGSHLADQSRSASHHLIADAMQTL